GARLGSSGERAPHGIENAGLRPFQRGIRQAVIREGANAPRELGGNGHGAAPSASWRTCAAREAGGRANAAALRPASRPKVAHDSRPVPPPYFSRNSPPTIPPAP